MRSDHGATLLVVDLYRVVDFQTAAAMKSILRCGAESKYTQIGGDMGSDRGRRQPDIDRAVVFMFIMFSPHDLLQRLFSRGVGVSICLGLRVIKSSSRM